MFLGREREFKKLNLLWEKESFEMAVIYGRRRVGKTTLINEFCKGKANIFFAAMESSKEANLSAFSESVFIAKGQESAAVYTGYIDLLREVGQMAKKERMILVIDEYPYLARADQSFSSLLQNQIDHVLKDTKLFLILCGSSISFMENQVLGYKSPLFGRRTAQFKILPFDYYDTARCFPDYQDEDRAFAYGISGGIPLYINRLREYSDIWEAIKMEIFDTSGYLFEEPGNLLKQELREPQTYNAIVTAIANGCSRLNEIAMKASLDTGTCSKYIRNLTSLGIVEKELPVGEANSRKSIYRINDQLFRFWYRFVPSNMNQIVSGKIEKTFEKAVKNKLSDYMGLVFEEICKQYILFRVDELPINLGDIGQWWGTDSKRKRQVQIDMVVLSPDRKQAIFGECKYRNQLLDVEILDELIEDSNAYPGNIKKYYYLFSKSGFTDRIIKRAKKENIMLVTLKDMMHITEQ